LIEFGIIQNVFSQTTEATPIGAASSATGGLMAIENEATPRAKDRLDLVKRFFSVAISIGVGSTLVKAKWISDGRLPNSTEAEQLFIILLALYATVLSWDGYLASVQKKPLNGWLRFAIDIFLVIIYTILIITSETPWRWLPILCLIFALYVVWDAASVWEYPGSFEREYQVGSSRLLTVLRVFSLAILDRRGIDRGPLISLAWAAYFVILWRVVHNLYPQFSVFWVLFAAGAGLWLYRKDKERTGADGMRGFKMCSRTLIIMGLVAGAVLFPQVTIKV
jgi:hypothetical protein